MSEILISELLKLTKEKTKGQLEEEIGLSKNSLASVLSGKKKFSNKALGKVEKYLNKIVPYFVDETKGVSSTVISEKIHEIDPFPSDDEFALIVGRKIMAWCGQNGVNPGDIVSYLNTIRSENEANLKVINAIKDAKKKLKADGVGIRVETKPAYDPFKNPRFNGKIGVKASDKKENGE